MREYTADDIVSYWGANVYTEKGRAAAPIVVKDAIVTEYGSYDAAGKLIPESVYAKAYKNSPDSQPQITAPKPVDVDEVAEYIDTTHYDHEMDEAYLISAASRAWGHFLTETLARCQHLFGADIPSTVLCGPTRCSIQRLRKLFPDFRFIKQTKNVKVKTLYMPIPTFINWHSVLPEHLETCRKVGDHYGRVAVKSAKVFLSRTCFIKEIPEQRSGVERTRCHNAPELEALLKSAGWEVIYPQNFTVAEQISIFENARIVAGLVGSAFHTLLLTRRNPAKIVYLTATHRHDTHCSFAMVDVAMKTNAVYLDCMDVLTDRGLNNKWNRKIRDVAATFAYLEAAAEQMPPQFG